MITETYNQVVEHWKPVSEFLSVPKSDEQCDRMTEFLNHLLDETGDNENHPLFPLIETLTALIESYETRTIPEPETSPSEILQFLMEENSLTPKDLKELGTEQEINELLKGKAFDTYQIRYMCQRFHLGADVFS
jgi:HTH-type transcriptional regulator/antitoxin HigA